MQKNKLTSYLLYALGEILLVVIGILIAVQINNQNNQWKLNESEKLALGRLVEDLRSDIKRFEYLDNRLSERINKCDSTLTLIYNQQTLGDRLAIISIHQINFFLVEANTTTYDEMLNTGKLYSMSNAKLRGDIINYYRQVKKWSTYIEKENNQLRRLKTNPAYNDYWLVQETIWAERKVDTKKFPWLASRYSRELSDIEALINQAEDVFKFNRSNIGYLKKAAQQLLDRIELTYLK